MMSILGSIVQMNHALKVDSPEPANPGMLNAALKKAVRMAPHDVLVVLVSDFNGIDVETEKLATRLAAHNDMLAVLVHDPVRMRPPEGTIAVSDGSLQMAIDFNRKQVREKVLRDYEDEENRIKHFLRRLSAPLLTVSNEGDVVDQIRRLLGVQRGVPK